MDRDDSNVRNRFTYNKTIPFEFCLYFVCFRPNYAICIVSPIHVNMHIYESQLTKLLRFKSKKDQGDASSDHVPLTQFYFINLYLLVTYVAIC